MVGAQLVGWRGAPAGGRVVVVVGSYEERASDARAPPWSLLFYLVRNLMRSGHGRAGRGAEIVNNVLQLQLYW